jgi:hypothetical protein
MSLGCRNLLQNICGPHTATLPSFLFTKKVWLYEFSSTDMHNTELFCFFTHLQQTFWPGVERTLGCQLSNLAALKTMYQLTLFF